MHSFSRGEEVSRTGQKHSVLTAPLDRNVYKEQLIVKKKGSGQVLLIQPEAR